MGELRHLPIAETQVASVFEEDEILDADERRMEAMSPDERTVYIWKVALRDIDERIGEGHPVEQLSLELRGQILDILENPATNLKLHNHGMQILHDLDIIIEHF